MPCARAKLAQRCRWWCVPEGSRLSYVVHFASQLTEGEEDISNPKTVCLEEAAGNVVVPSDGLVYTPEHVVPALETLFHNVATNKGLNAEVARDVRESLGRVFEREVSVESSYGHMVTHGGVGLAIQARLPVVLQLLHIEHELHHSAVVLDYENPIRRPFVFFHGLDTYYAVPGLS